MDRLITIHLEHYDRETEILIVKKKSGLPREDAERIVDMVRELRTFGCEQPPPDHQSGHSHRPHPFFPKTPGMFG